MPSGSLDADASTATAKLVVFCVKLALGNTFGAAIDETDRSSMVTFRPFVPPPRYAQTPARPASGRTLDVAVTCQLDGSALPFAHALARRVEPSTCDLSMIRVLALMANGSVVSAPIDVAALDEFTDRKPKEIFLSGVMRSRGS